MNNLTKDLYSIYSLWAFDLLSKLEYDGNGTYSISKEEVDKVKKSIQSYDNLDKAQKKLLDRQSTRLEVSLL
jgi:putative heme degradation protein